MIEAVFERVLKLAELKMFGAAHIGAVQKWAMLRGIRHYIPPKSTTPFYRPAAIGAMNASHGDDEVIFFRNNRRLKLSSLSDLGPQENRHAYPAWGIHSRHPI